MPRTAGPASRGRHHSLAVAACTLLDPSLPSFLLLAFAHTDHHANPHAQSLPLTSLPARRCRFCHGSRERWSRMLSAFAPVPFALLLDDGSRCCLLTLPTHTPHNTVPCSHHAELPHRKCARPFVPCCFLDDGSRCCPLMIISRRPNPSLQHTTAPCRAPSWQAAGWQSPVSVPLSPRPVTC